MKEFNSALFWFDLFILTAFIKQIRILLGGPHFVRPASFCEASLKYWGKELGLPHIIVRIFLNKCSVNKKIKSKQGTIELFHKLMTFFFNVKDSF